MYIKTQKCSFWCNDNNCSYVGKICTFSYGKVSDIFGRIASNVSWGGQREGVRGSIREKPKWGLFLWIPNIKQETNFILQICWSDKLLITTIAISMPKNLNAETFKWFQAVLPDQKPLCVFFNTCPQWHRYCRCHRQCRHCRWHRQHWWLQQGDWYSTAEGFQLY